MDDEVKSIEQRLVAVEALLQQQAVRLERQFKAKPVISFGVSADVLAKLSDLAIARDVTRSELLRYIIDHWLASNSSKQQKKRSQSTLQQQSFSVVNDIQPEVNNTSIELEF
ncbi:MAG: ribbon-helix-helix protein, CopG family [Microcoleus sp. PH2017_27_LUM_O_A]|uniref:ribbon-helix-helix protein, CopG family n=1 Tax=unclassified Microcoleus TaxID=2642155 RepID=UPI001DFDCF8C|nr:MULTISPECIES: ribbon-helix-helix protein, CopG family [unclassified Microcoleus]MCC3532537.1 ribbon-helix-helix protein, CopG family [Microcoleus sp. PH2017_21_RUC_O_A]MCC3544774.1 ribbon-helix-helix protein, CopG family [Microcoleus sp. PH2017_22_RUC_O_B]MCC3563739.1 ribbon-helix-helix protein, CopG family [Microcoleus sp. PH2017_27_LUM_O_A]